MPDKPSKIANEVGDKIIELKIKAEENDDYDPDEKYRDLEKERQEGLEASQNIEMESKEVAGIAESKEEGYNKVGERSFDIVTNKKEAEKEIEELEQDPEGQLVDKDPWKKAPIKENERRQKENIISNILKNVTRVIAQRISVARHNLKNTDHMNQIAGPMTEKTDVSETIEKPARKEKPALKALQVGQVVPEKATPQKEEIKVESKDKVSNQGKNSHDTSEVTTSFIEKDAKTGKTEVKTSTTSQIGNYDEKSEVKSANLGNLSPSSTPSAADDLLKKLGIDQQSGSMSR